MIKSELHHKSTSKIAHCKTLFFLLDRALRTLQHLRPQDRLYLLSIVRFEINFLQSVVLSIVCIYKFGGQFVFENTFYGIRLPAGFKFKFIFELDSA